MEYAASCAASRGPGPLWCSKPRSARAQSRDESSDMPHPSREVRGIHWLEGGAPGSKDGESPYPPPRYSRSPP